MERVNKGKYFYLPFLVAIVLFVIPFFWFWGGVIDWGGDSTRIYYLNPKLYFLHHALYGVSPSDTGGQLVSFNSIPYLSLIAFLRFFFDTSFVIALFHGMKLSMAFLFTYFALFELLKINVLRKIKYLQYVSIISGLIYVFSPILIIGWDKVILTHDQLFLNPLMFYLFLRFLHTSRFIYFLVALLVSFFFSHNFSFGAAPPVVAFYSISITFLLTYLLIIRKKPILWKKLILGFALFLLLHSFHLYPLLLQVFNPGSDAYNNIFSTSGKFDRGLSYFTEIAKVVRLSNSILILPQLNELKFLNLYSIVFPVTIVAALILRKNKLLLLISIFFLLTLYFVTANITTLGLGIYTLLFNLPGFSMFRNFYGQWSYAYLFFYVLLIGSSIYYLTSTFRFRRNIIFLLIIFGFLILNSWEFLLGAGVNKIIWQSNNVPILSRPDENFLKSLEFVRNIKNDSKVLTLPITDPGYQIVLGTNGGAYQGPSLVSYLGGKRDFPGLNSFGVYANLLQDSVKKNDYTLIKQILSFNNIKYIFHNSDPGAYEKNFPKFPYEMSRLYFPSTQSGYKAFINSLGATKLANFGKYDVYLINDSDFLPHIYAADNIVATNSFINVFTTLGKKDGKTAFVENIKYGASHIEEFYEAIQLNPYDQLIYNNHLHIHNPFVSKNPNSPLFPAVLYKEDLQLKSHNRNIADKVDYSLYLLSKRILEFISFGDKMGLSTGNDWYGGKYTNWTSNLQRIIEQYSGLLDHVTKSKSADDEKLAELIKIQEQLLRNQSQLVTSVREGTKSPNDKTVLTNLINDYFSTLVKKANIPYFNADISSYELILPGEGKDLRSLYLENLEGFDKSSQENTLIIDGKVIALTDGIENGKYTKYTGIEFNLGKKIEISLNRLHTNLYKGPSQLELSSSDLSTETFSINLGEMLSQKQYLISFEYKTDGSNFSYSFLDTKNKPKEKDIRNSYFTKDLSSKEWSIAQTLITTDFSFLKGFLEFKTNNSKSDQRILMRNITVKEIINPNLIVAKEIITKNVPPTISSKKLDPTKYEIDVRNAKDPYLLVFSDQIGKDWHLFQGNHEVAKDTHTMANGYANAWYITPSETHKKDYTLILENTAQRRFYIGATISLITLTVLIFTISLKVLKWQKKR